MKLKKIAALCKQRKRAIIYQRWKTDPDHGERKMTKQFISNGKNAVVEDQVSLFDGIQEE